MKKLISMLLVITLVFGIAVFSPINSEASEAEAPELILNEEYNVETTDDEKTFMVRTEETDFYCIRLTNVSEDSWIVAGLYNYYNSWATYGSGREEYSIVWKAEAGATYYLNVECVADSYTVCMGKAALTFNTLNVGEPYPVGDTGEEVWFTFVPEETGRYRFYSTDGDAACPSANLYDSSMLERVNRNGSSEKCDFSGYYQLEAGKTYYLKTRASYEGYTYTVHVEKTLAAVGIELISGEVGPLIENKDGYWMEYDDEEFFYYQYNLSDYDIQLKIIYEDGSSLETAYTDSINGERLNYYDVQSYENTWIIGGDNFVILTYQNVSAHIPVTIVEDAVESVAFKTKPTLSHSLSNWEYDTEEDKYIIQPSLQGMELLIQYMDGSSEVYTVDDIDEDGYLNGHYVDVSELWIEGAGTYTATLTYMEYELDFEVEVQELICDYTLREDIPCEITDNNDGTWIEFVPRESGFYCIYSTLADAEDTYATLYDEGMKRVSSNDDGGVGKNFAITYFLHAGKTYRLKSILYGNTGTYTVFADKKEIETLELDNPFEIIGSEKEVWLKIKPEETSKYHIYSYNASDYMSISLYDVNFDWLNGDGNFEVSLIEQLEKGKTYYLNVVPEDGVLSCDICMEKALEPVDIEVISGEVGPLIENIDGYWDDDEEQFYYRYDLNDYDIQLKISYEDGSSIEVPYSDSIKGIALSCDDTQYQMPWTVDGNNYIILSYQDVSVEVPVMVIENPVKSISVQKDPTKRYILEELYYDEGEYSLYYDEYDLTGIELLIEYKDGSSKIYTVEDMEAECWNGHYYYYLNGYDISCDTLYVREAGTYVVILNYLGYETEYSCRIIKSPIKSVEVVKDPDNTKPAYLPDFLGMQIKITYMDDKYTTVTINEENLMYGYDYLDSYGDNITDYVVTEGDLKIKITPYVDGYYDDVSEEFHMEFFGWEVSVMGKSYIYSGIEQQKEKEIAEVKVSGASIEARNMILNVIYADGTIEKIIVNPIYAQVYDSHSMGLFRTSQGIAEYSVTAIDDDSDGKIDRYEIFVFGKFISGEADCIHKEAKVIAAKEATCTAEGNIKYWTCPCGKFFKDAAFIQEITLKDTVIAKRQHMEVVVQGKAATDKVTGLTKGKKCAVCGIETVKQQVIAKLKAPKMKKVTGGKKKITIKFKKITGIDGYEIQVATKKNMKKGLKTYKMSASKAKCVIKNLKAKKKYWVRIRTYKVVDGEKNTSNWSKKLVVKTRK